MKSSYLVSIGGGVVALGCAALMFQTARETPDRGPAGSITAPRDGSQGDGAATSAMLQARGEPPALRVRAAGLDTGNDDSERVSSETEPGRKLGRAEKLSADAQLHAAYIAKVEDAYEREAADPGWSGSMTSRIWDTVSQMDVMRGATRAAECRSRSCRIEVDDDGSGTLHKNLPVFAQQFADVLPVMAGKPVRDESGRGRMILYLMEMDQRPVGR
jgi:hypothetical protein